MPLPTPNEEMSFRQIELLSGKKIGIKPWRVREEKELLFATEGMEQEKDVKKEVVKFLKRMVDNQSLFETLSNTDTVHLLAELRKLSKGSKIEYNYNCTECGFNLSDDVSLIDHLIVKKFDSKPIKVSDTLTFAIKEVSFADYMKLQETCTKLSEYNYMYIIKSIESVVKNGEVFENFSEAELIDYVDTLSSLEFDALAKGVDAAGAEIKLEKKLKCGKCKHVNDVIFGDLHHFFVF